MSITKAFVMSIHPSFRDEYKRRHDEIWPELSTTLKNHGAANYSIFLHPDTLQLFAYVEIENEERWNAVAKTEICQRWWAYMRDIMPSNPDNSPVSQELVQVFHLP